MPLWRRLSRPPPPLPPQTRKDVAQVFCGLLRVSVDGRFPCVAYLSAHKELLDTLTHGCAALRSLRQEGGR